LIVEGHPQKRLHRRLPPGKIQRRAQETIHHHRLRPAQRRKSHRSKRPRVPTTRRHPQTLEKTRRAPDLTWLRHLAAGRALGFIHIVANTMAGTLFRSVRANALRMFSPQRHSIRPPFSRTVRKTVPAAPFGYGPAKDVDKDQGRAGGVPPPGTRIDTLSKPR